MQERISNIMAVGTPCLMGFLSCHIGWFLVGVGLPIWVGAGASLGLFIATVASFVKERKQIMTFMTQEDKTETYGLLTLTTGSEPPPPLHENNVDEIPLHEIKLEENSFGDTAVMIRRKVADPERIEVQVLVDNVYIRSVSFPIGRKVIDDVNGLTKHCRKYSDVAQAIAGRKVVTTRLSVTDGQHRSIYLYTDEKLVPNLD